MVTKRTPIARQMATPQITTEAVAIWRQMKRCKCTCGPYPNPKQWWGREECLGCTRWWDLHSRLAGLIAHRVWEWPLVCPPTKYPEYDFGLQRFTNEFRPRQGNERMRELERALRAGAKDMRTQRRSSVQDTGEVSTDEGALVGE